MNNNKQQLDRNFTNQFFMKKIERVNKMRWGLVEEED